MERQRKRSYGKAKEAELWVGSPATCMSVVWVGDLGSAGRLTRLATPPLVCPRRRPSWSCIPSSGGSEGVGEETSSPPPPPTERADATGKSAKKMKVLSRKHKSPVGEGGSRPRSKGKEPAASPARPEAPAESEEGAASPVHERPRSMKDLFRTKVYKGDQGYYALMMSDLGHQDPEKELQARWARLRNSTKVWHTSSAAEEYERGILHPQLARELYTLPSEVLMARATKELVL
ncbi:hypothetical protein BHE74_00045363, partial [Ensete ventricosum]